MKIFSTPEGDYLGPAEFAQATGLAEKTVRRRLEAGKLDGAWQDPHTRRWLIPVNLIDEQSKSKDSPMTKSVDIRRPDPTLVPVHYDTPAHVRPVDFGFDVIPVDVVAATMGVTRGTVIRWGRMGKLDVGPYGVDGALAVWIER